MTKIEFYNHEVFIWGEEYIEDLIERGYLPFFDNRRNRWSWRYSLDKAADNCYRGRRPSVSPVSGGTAVIRG